MLWLPQQHIWVAEHSCGITKDGKIIFFPKKQGCPDTSIQTRIPYPTSYKKMVSNPVSVSGKIMVSDPASVYPIGIHIREKNFWYPIRYPYPKKVFLVSDPVSARIRIIVSEGIHGYQYPGIPAFTV